MKIVFILSLFFFSFFSEANSKQVRSKKSWEITGHLSTFDYLLPTTQIMVGHYLDSDNLIGLRAGHSRAVLFGEGQQTNVALQWKHFLGNSFNFSIEAYYLNSYLEELLLVDTKLKQIMLGAGFRLGNQWSSGTLTWGVDWVGAGHKIIGLHDDQYGTSSGLTITLLNFYIGLAF